MHFRYASFTLFTVIFKTPLITLNLANIPIGAILIQQENLRIKFKTSMYKTCTTVYTKHLGSLEQNSSKPFLYSNLPHNLRVGKQAELHSLFKLYEIQQWRSSTKCNVWL